MGNWEIGKLDMKKHTILFAFALLGFCPINAQNGFLDEIIEQYQDFQENEFNNPEKYFPSESSADQARRAGFYKKTLADLSNVKKEGLDEQAQINFDLLKFILEDKVAMIEFEDYLVPLNAEGGWHTRFIVDNDRQRLTSVDDFEKYIEKLNAFKTYAAEQSSLMKKGMEKGRMAPYAILAGRENLVDGQLVEDPENSPFFKHFKDMPPSISKEEKTRLQTAAKEAIENSVIPAYRAFSKFWKEEYIPNAPKEIGISAQPNGREFYEQRVRYYTTLDMTPEEVYETGKKEVARIRKEMEAIIAEVGFEGSFAEFLHFLRTDGQFYAKTPEELLKEASYLSKRIDGILPRYFGKLPRNSYGVQPVPAAIAPTYTSGRYSGGSLAKGTAGNYWVNTYNLPARPLYALPSLTLHEAVPGHHLQISLAQEMENVPSFRKQTYLSAYGEGWALYCEWLGEEMGIYTTPYQHFGKLTYEMWRACRLVVDPGMHVFGMSRQEAIDFMSSNTALSLHECTTEIDRYIGWPGQAVSYKIGELKIRELRKMAEAELGDKFNLRDFHDLVLSNGAVPLFVLERMVDDWVDNFKEKK